MKFVQKHGFNLTKCLGVDGTFGMSREKIETFALVGKSPITGSGFPIAHLLFASRREDTGSAASQSVQAPGELEDVMYEFMCDDENVM